MKRAEASLQFQPANRPRDGKGNGWFPFRLGVATNCLTVFLCVGMQGGGAAASRPAPQAYPVFVWKPAGPVTQEWADAVRELGFSGVNVQGAANPEGPASRGLEFYADHLASRPFFHRDNDDAIWNAARDGYVRTRSRDSLVRTPSLDDPDFIVILRKQVAERAAKAAKSGARFLSITDEPSFTVGLCPLDFDQSPASIRKFRQNLQLTFPDILQLSKMWGIAARSHDEFSLITTDEILAREWARRDGWNFAPWAAARAHADRALAEALGVAMAEARAAAPGLRVGFLGTQPPAAFGGYDWGKLILQKPDILEIYDSGAARDLVRALAPGVDLVDTTFATESFANSPPEIAAARMSWLFARGGRSAILWSSEVLFNNNNPAAPTAIAKELGARAIELRRLAGELAGAAVARDDIAIVYSHPSIQIGWLFDARSDRATWVNRRTSYELEHSTALASLEGWFRICEDLGYSPGAVDARALGVISNNGDNNNGDNNKVDHAGRLPKVLILPRTLALDDAEIAALRAHAAGGGLLIFEGRPAIFNNNLVSRVREDGRPRGAFDDFFQLKDLPFGGFADENCNINKNAVRNAGGLLLLEPELQFARSLGTSPAIFRAQGGVLMNISLVEYRDQRLARENPAAQALRKEVGELLQSAIGPPLARAISATGLPVAVDRLARGDEEYFFVTSNVRRKTGIALGSDRAVETKLQFTGSRLRTFERLDGSGAPFQVETAPGGNALLTFSLDPLHLALFRARPAPPATAK